jgi:hypothetical protein
MVLICARGMRETVASTRPVDGVRHGRWAGAGGPGTMAQKERGEQGGASSGPCQISLAPYPIGVDGR